MRISDWAHRFNVHVRPNEERPDTPVGDIVYRVKDVFTTRDGSWELSDKPGSIPQWARDAYLRPWGAPDHFDDAGADHHLFARVLDETGQLVKAQDFVVFWSDGFHKLGDAGYQGYVRMTPKERSGWANQVVFNSYNPDRGERGAWCWCPSGPADVVEGGGLPNNHHISFFVVWQAELRAPGPGNGGGPEPDDNGTDGAEPILSELRRLSWGQTHLAVNPASELASYARRLSLGAPVTEEFGLAGYRVQGFANGIVYAPIGRPDQARHATW